MANLEKIFAALGEHTRFCVVEQLLREGEQSVQQLYVDKTISPPAFSRHLKVLKEADIVNIRIDKQRRIYSVKPGAVKTIHTWVMDHETFWRDSLDRLEIALNEAEQEDKA